MLKSRNLLWFAKPKFHICKQHTNSQKSTTEPVVKDKFAFKVSKSFEEGLLNGKFKAKAHPAIMNVKSVHLPPEITEAITKIKEDREYASHTLKRDAEALAVHLWNRKPPYEEEELRDALNNVAAKLINKGELPHDFAKEGEKSIDDLTMTEKRKLQKSLRQHVYNWKPLELTDYSSFVYLWGRSAPEYAALVRIFHEIKKRKKNFEPRSLFDFGSGVGTVSWAVDSIWPDICKEVYNVDANTSMNTLSEVLLRGGVNDGPPPPRLKNTYYRQFLPSSENLKYDLVVSSRSFFELGYINNRIRTVDILWRKVSPGGFLVLVEAGTKHGYSVLLALRDYLLEICKVEREKYSLNSPIHIFSPCSHDKFCPRYYHQSGTACSFIVQYFSFSQSTTLRDKFSYIVLQKEDRETAEDFPRVVQDCLNRKNHVISRVCTPGGSIRELVVSKSRHGTPCYQLCKNSEWGDLLPIHLDDDSVKDNVDQVINKSEQPIANCESSS